jgi:hypothetical protein
MLPTKALALAAVVLVSAMSAASAQSCRQTVGTKKAEALVRQCMRVSQATHPPCNAANPCDMIAGEIEHGCGELRDARLAVPAFCKEYLH